MWHVLTGEAQLVRQVFSNLLEVLSLSLPYQEKIKSNRTIRIETEIPKSVSNSLYHFMMHLLTLVILSLSPLHVRPPPA